MEEIRDLLRQVTTDVANGGQSRLEKQAVGVATQKDYAKRLSQFHDFCTQALLPHESEAELEVALLEFFDWAFVQGRPLDVGGAF